jgi:hypothetical protein
MPVKDLMNLTGSSHLEGDSTEDVLTVGEEELRILHALLADAGKSSPAAGRLAEAVRNALVHHRELLVVMGTTDEPAVQHQRLHERLEALIEQMMPRDDVLSETSAVLSQRNSQRRVELLTEFGAMTGEQIAEERSRAQNRHALAARWRKERKLFGVPYRGQTVYPAFQFDDDGHLRPIVEEVLHHLPTDRMSPWEVALWWTADNGWLGGRRPVDVLDDDSRAIVRAADALAAPSPL